mgnify:FL=1
MNFKAPKLLLPLFVVGVTFASFLYLFLNISIANIFSSITLFSPGVLSIAFLAIFLNLCLNCVRFYFVARTFKLKLSFLVSVKAVLYGLLGGLLFLQFIGQTASRATILSRMGVSTSSTIVMTAYERILSLFVLGGTGFLGLLWLSKDIVLDIANGGTDLIVLIASVSSILTLVFIFANPHLLQRMVRVLFNVSTLLSVLRDGILTFLTQVCMLFGYLALASSFVPSMNVADFAAASLIIMFVASVPISFSGWGIRELSAVYAYGVLGLLEANALAISLMVGLFSLFVLFLSMVLVWIIGSTSKFVSEAKKHEYKETGPDYSRFLSYFLPVLAATLVLFQVYIPFGNNILSVNLADPIAIVGGFVFLFRYIQQKNRKEFLRIQGIELLLVGATSIICLSFLIGYLDYGFVNWAFYNRLVGWFIILGYVGTGALIISEAGLSAFTTFSRTFVFALAGVVLLGFIEMVTINVGGSTQYFVRNSQLLGFVQNPNAFSFQLLIGASIAFSAFKGDADQYANMKRFTWIILTAIILAGLFHAKSRVGYCVATGLIILSIYFRYLKVILLGKIALLATAIATLPHVISFFMNSMTTSGAVRYSFQVVKKVFRMNSDGERMQTLVDALKMFQETPIFGSGIGKFISTHMGVDGIPIVIHSSIGWLLAESGIVGFLIFSGGFFWILRQSLWKVRNEGFLTDRVTLLIMCAMGIFCTVHDMLYQRSFWLILGACLLKSRFPSTQKESVSTEKHSQTAAVLSTS